MGPRPGSDDMGETVPGVLVVTPLRLEDRLRGGGRGRAAGLRNQRAKAVRAEKLQSSGSSP